VNPNGKVRATEIIGPKVVQNMAKSGPKIEKPVEKKCKKSGPRNGHKTPLINGVLGVPPKPH